MRSRTRSCRLTRHSATSSRRIRPPMAAPRSRSPRCPAASAGTTRHPQPHHHQQSDADQIHDWPRGDRSIEAEMLAIAHKEGSPMSPLSRFAEEPTQSTFRLPPSRSSMTSQVHRPDAGRSCRSFSPTSRRRPVTVEAMPSFQSAMATHYQTGTPDGKWPGRVVVATSDFAQRTFDQRRSDGLSRGHPGPPHADSPWRSR